MMPLDPNWKPLGALARKIVDDARRAFEARHTAAEREPQPAQEAAE